jgi:hypothetical protein
LRSDCPDAWRRDEACTTPSFQEYLLDLGRSSDLTHLPQSEHGHLPADNLRVDRIAVRLTNIAHELLRRLAAVAGHRHALDNND